MILIIAHYIDTEANGLFHLLKKQNKEVNLIYIEDFFTSYRIDYYLDNDSTRFELEHKETKSKFSSIDIEILINRTHNINLSFVEGDQGYGNMELFALWNSLISGLECIVCNKPDCISYFGLGISDLESKDHILTSGLSFSSDFCLHSSRLLNTNDKVCHYYNQSINSLPAIEAQVAVLANKIQLLNFQLVLNEKNQVKSISATPNYSTDYPFYITQLTL